MQKLAPLLAASLALLLSAPSAIAVPVPATCSATSGPAITPVVELFTSEGCSSCPPADQWASRLKGSGAVVQAFHVGYWDYIGWVDRFALPAHNVRQREIAARNQLRHVYTPQVVLNGKDTPDWPSLKAPPRSTEPARLTIALTQLGPDQFEAQVASATAAGSQPTAIAWSAYWSVTEHGHQSKVKAGENAGEHLKHDFVVRQYTRAGDYPASSEAQKLSLRSIAATPGHERQVNLVLFDRKTGATLQALSLQCGA